MIGASPTEYFQPSSDAEAANAIEYHGRFTGETVTRMLDTIAIRLKADGEDLRTRRRILRVMVETLQNIVRHRKPGSGSADAFSLRKQGSQYILVCGNPVVRSAVPRLAARLEGVNSLNRQELKDLYQRLLATSHAGGLGFVDIARKSGTKMRFDFHEISDEHCFFELTVALESGGGSGTKTK